MPRSFHPGSGRSNSERKTKTLSKTCWNCKAEIDILQSPRTGIEYCASCGAAMEGVGWIATMNRTFGAKKTGTQHPEDLPSDDPADAMPDPEEEGGRE